MLVSRYFGDVGNSSLRNAKGLASVSGPGRPLLAWRDHLARRSFGQSVLSSLAQKKEVVEKQSHDSDGPSTLATCSGFDRQSFRDTLADVTGP